MHFAHFWRLQSLRSRYKQHPCLLKSHSIIQMPTLTLCSFAEHTQQKALHAHFYLLKEKTNHESGVLVTLSPPIHFTFKTVTLGFQHRDSGRTQTYTQGSLPFCHTYSQYQVFSTHNVYFPLNCSFYHSRRL